MFWALLKLKYFHIKFYLRQLELILLQTKDLEVKILSLIDSKKIIYESLEYGRCFVSNYYHGNAKGFKFFAKSGNKIYQMGDTIKKNGKI